MGPIKLAGTTEDKACLPPKLGLVPQGRVWDGGRQAGLGKAGATRSRGWDSAEGPVHLICAVRNNGWVGAAWPTAEAHLCFPSQLGSFRTLPAHSLSSRPILSAGPWTAHSFMLISSQWLQVHVLTVRLEARPGTGVMWKGAQAGLSRPVALHSELRGHLRGGRSTCSGPGFPSTQPALRIGLLSPYPASPAIR